MERNAWAGLSTGSRPFDAYDILVEAEGHEQAKGAPT